MKDILLRNREISKDTVETIHVSSVSYTVTGNWVVEIDNIVRLPREEVTKAIDGHNIRYEMKVKFLFPLASTVDSEGGFIDTDPRIKAGKFVHVEYGVPVIDKK